MIITFIISLVGPLPKDYPGWRPTTPSVSEDESPKTPEPTVDQPKPPKPPPVKDKGSI